MFSLLFDLSSCKVNIIYKTTEADAVTQLQFYKHPSKHSALNHFIKAYFQKRVNFSFIHVANVCMFKMNSIKQCVISLLFTLICFIHDYLYFLYFREINLGSNELAEPTASIMSQVVIKNLTLRSVDLSCNRLGPVSTCQQSHHDFGFF